MASLEKQLQMDILDNHRVRKELVEENARKGTYM